MEFHQRNKAEIKRVLEEVNKEKSILAEERDNWMKKSLALTRQVQHQRGLWFDHLMPFYDSYSVVLFGVSMPFMFQVFRKDSSENLRQKEV